MPPKPRGTTRPSFIADDEPIDTIKPPQPPRPLRPNSAPRTAKTPPVTPPPSPGKYVEVVEKLYSRAAMGLMMFAPKTVELMTEEMPVDIAKPDGETEMRLTKCAKAWDALAVKNPHVRRMLEKAAATGPVAELVELNGPILVSMAGELGLFSQLGTLAGKFFNRRRKDEPTPTRYYEYDAAGHPMNPEFGRTVA